jgi:hypothetical protein
LMQRGLEGAGDNLEGAGWAGGRGNQQQRI